MNIQPSGLRKALQVIGMAVGLLLLSLPALSQGNTGRILGTVTDQTGGVIPGSAVTVRDVQRGISRALTTDSAGEYSAPNLIPGTYSVRAEAKGFKVVERQSILLEVGQDIRVDLQLQTGDTTQTVTVTEEAPQINTTDATLGGALSNQTINDLPLNGRNFTNLLTLRPGVAIYPGGGGWTQSTNDLRSHDQNYMVDGVVSNDPWGAQAILNGALPAGDASTLIPIDAIDEFKTEVNAPAQYGWKPGTVVNVGIKSGTNSIHGTAYAYGRSDAFDARTYFNHEGSGCAAPCPKTPVELEQFGASIGGPIKHDKLFYFLSYEDQRYSVGNPLLTTVPITSPTSTDPQSLTGACQAALDPGGLGVTNLSAQLAGIKVNPTPVTGHPNGVCAPDTNFPGLFPVNNGTTTSLFTDLTSQNEIDSGVVKVNYHINEHHSLNGVYIISQGTGTQVDAPGVEVSNDWTTLQHERAQVGSGDWTWTPNSSWVNEARFSQAREYSNFFTPDHDLDPANYTSHGSTYHLYTGQTNPFYFGFPQIGIFGFLGQLGGSWPYRYGPDAVTQGADNVSVVRGKHALKFGGEILKNTATSNEAVTTKGLIFFPTVQDYFSGNAAFATKLFGDLLRHFSNWGYALFVQDDWRVTPRFTLNLGLRYEISTVMKDSNNLMGNFDPAHGMQQLGKQISSLYNGDHHNFAPRLGLAWDVRGNGKTVIRAGAGLYYEMLSYDVFNAGGAALRTMPTGVNLYANGAQVASPGSIVAGEVPPNLGTSKAGQFGYDWINNGPNVPLFQPTPSCGDGSFTDSTGFTPTPCTIMGVNRNLTTPDVITWTVDLQRAITNSLSLEIGYVANRGARLLGLRDINEPPLGTGWTAAAKGACLASAPSYNNCFSDGGAEQAARPFTASCPAAPCFPYLSYVPFYFNSDLSRYQSLQTILTQRNAHGLSFTAGYTYSHGLDNSSDNQQVLHIPISGNQRELYASSDFDIRHRFTFTTTYDIPGKKSPGQILQGWSLNSIVTIQTGLPWGVGDTSNDFSGTGEVFDTAGPGGPLGELWNFYGNPGDFQLVHGFTNTGGVPSSRADTSGKIMAACIAADTSHFSGTQLQLALASLTNAGCYASGNSVLVPPPYGSIGTSGRNIFRDGGFRNWDLSVTKSWKFRERLSAQFRAEFFNFLNHPNFANPWGGSGGGARTNDPSKGAYGCGCTTPDVGGANPVLGTGGARNVQLGLKLIF